MSSYSKSKATDDQAKLKKRLDVLTKLEENKFCADCGTRSPRWASINLGVFICISCSGIHRSLGVHLTFVRSVNLDSWTEAQVIQMEQWGNGRAKEYYEANVPRDVRIPNEHSSVRDKERWIREKYERRLYISKDEPPQAKKRGSGRKETSSVSSDEEVEPVKQRSSSRKPKTPPKSASSSATTNNKTKEKATTQDLFSFDAFDTPAPVPAPSTHQTAFPAPPPAIAANDEWNNFQGSSGNGTVATANTVNAQQNKVASIMDMFGTPASSIQQPMGGQNFNMGGMQQMGMNNMAPSGMNMGMGFIPQMGNGMPQVNMNNMYMYNGQQQMQRPPQAANPMFNMGGMNPMMNNGQNFSGIGMPQQMQQQNGMPGMNMNMNMGMGMGMGMPMNGNPMNMNMNMNVMAFNSQQSTIPNPQQKSQGGGLNQAFVTFQ